MSNPVLTLPVKPGLENNLGEALRYLGYRGIEPTVEVKRLLTTSNQELLNQVTPKCCYQKVTITRHDDQLQLGGYTVTSKSLMKNLSGCQEAYLFVATIGVGADRLINRYTRLQPSKGVIIDALGSSYIEVVCDYICDQLALQAGYQLKPRFSPGYGDVPLTSNRQLLQVLDSSRKIGVTINDGDLMFPTKTVSAIVGITTTMGPTEHVHCQHCQENCQYQERKKDERS